MEALLVEYAKRYGIDKAMEMLGLTEQKQNPKYAISLGGKTFDLKNIAARTGINSLMSGSGMALPLFVGGLGLAYARNPLRPGSMNYNPALKGQMDYLNFNNMIGSNSGTGLAQYGPGSVLSGQNVVSLFGTNDYEKQLQNKIDYFEDRISKGKDINEKKYNEAKKEQADIQDYNVQKTIETNQLRNLQNINAGNDGSGMQTSGFSNTDGGPVSNRTGRGRQGYGRGGIASLWQK